MARPRMAHCQHIIARRRERRSLSFRRQNCNRVRRTWDHRLQSWGRTLDTIPATIHLLPPIVDVVRQRVPILIDGGVRRGTDVFKCLALGASAVMIGRPILHGLAVAGARGVSHVLRILRDEFEIAMVLAGATRISQISDDRILRLARGPIASG